MVPTAPAIGRFGRYLRRGEPRKRSPVKEDEKPSNRLMVSGFTTPSVLPLREYGEFAVAGGEESQVLDHGYQGLWAVLDSGVALARLAPESVPAIEFFSFATRSLTTIRKPPKDMLLRTNWFGTSLAVSPDGLWILYAFDDRSESDLVMVENFR